MLEAPPTSAGARACRSLPVLALAVALAACQTTRTEEPPAATLASITRTEPARAWTLVRESELLGVVVWFVDPLDPGDPARQFYSVRNRWQQELGTLDAQGRAYRFLPHQREAHWIGTGTVLEGARAILEGGASAELLEVSLEDLRALAASAR